MHVATMIDSANRADFFSDLRNLYRGSAASPLTSTLSMSGKVTLNLRSQNSVISVAHTHTHTHSCKGNHATSGKVVVTTAFARLLSTKLVAREANDLQALVVVLAVDLLESW